MYNKSCRTCVLGQRRRSSSRQRLGSSLIPNRVIPFEHTLPWAYVSFILDRSLPDETKVERRCTCCPMLPSRAGPRRTSTDTMFIDLDEHVPSTNIRIDHVHC